jgi:polar amino acid transport system substrate-binding protein
MRQQLIGLLCMLGLGASAAAAEVSPVTPLDAVVPTRHLVIGTLHSPPFIIHNRDGSWSGISVELWRAIAAELGLTFEFEARSLHGVQDGSLDAAAAALTITEDRERHIDFTHPFHTTGFAIATRPGERTSVWFAVFQQLFSWAFLQVVGALALLLFVVGWIIWLVEHKHEPVQEDSHTIRHISEGFWWAAATMTTVGYGDKTPLTRIGRALGVIWMFTALMLVASFIAAFSSVLTVNKLSSGLSGPQDLVRANVATVPASTSEAYLVRHRIASTAYPSVEAAMQGLADGEVDAMVYDAPLLRYLARTEFGGRVEVLSVTFERQDYGFALPAGSALREPVNRALLRVIRGPDWPQTLARYLGD